MKERPILFNGSMVRAILEGRKTQARRVVRDEVRDVFTAHFSDDGNRFYPSCPYGQPGDRLWVREAYFGNHFMHPNEPENERELHYLADGLPDFEGEESQIRWRPSIHMPRWASRITLEITGVRVERLRAISEGDAIAEGLHKVEIGSGYLERYSATPTIWADVVEQQADAYEDPRLAYRDLWGSINGAESWDANPWVWVVEFKRVTS